jgi:hypothetical protein
MLDIVITIGEATLILFGIVFPVIASAVKEISPSYPAILRKTDRASTNKKFLGKVC